MIVTVFLLLAQALFYFALMGLLFRARNRLGLGAFVCALGVMHFMETYLAAVFYISLPFGTISPGSTILFTGKLAMLLLLYIKEDAEAVRQPIYGLLIGNFVTVGLVLFLRHMEPAAMPGRLPDLAFIDEMGWLMVWGTLLLYVDAIAMILIYERISRSRPEAVITNATIATALVLTFDQAGFYALLHMLTGAPASVLVGGWVAKMIAALFYAVLLGLYLRHVEPRPAHASQPLSDVFDKLTYRHRYEDLLRRTGLDALTGIRDRGRFEQAGAQAVERANAAGQPVSVIMADIDHLRRINEKHGRAVGDEVLRTMALTLASIVRDEDRVYRYGAEEFAIIGEGLDHRDAAYLAERLREAIQAAAEARLKVTVTASFGVATCPVNAHDVPGLVRCADARLYADKLSGRDCVVSDDNDKAGLDSRARRTPQTLG